MEPTLFRQCNVLYIDHLVVTTSNVEKTLADYLDMPGIRLIRGPALNRPQNVLYAFVQIAEGLIVNILGDREGSPVSRHVSQGGGPYHFCFAVANIEDSVRSAELMGAKVVTPPVPDVAFDGRRIAFLFHEAHGMFEFVEAYPAATSCSSAGYSDQKAPSKAQSPPGATALRSRLADVLRRIFPEAGKDQMAQAALNVTPGWDSLGHIRFMMAVEAEFEVSIPAARIPELTSFEYMCGYLENSAAPMEHL
jgi:acyl carrier protein/predicted enzyme related to lactoylglutathione lyase